VRPRFHVPGVNSSSEHVELPEEEAEHLARVLRLGVGDEVEIFDGAGTLWRAEVVQVGKRSASVRRIEELEPARELDVHLTLVFSVLKGDKNDDVVRDAVMLGFIAVQPIVTARTEASLAGLTRSARHERWHRIAVSSAKQCGRAVVPVVAPPIAFEGPASLAHLPSPQFLLVEPGAAAASVSVAGVDAAAPAAATLVIGPEGGWTPAEVEQCAHHAHPLTLGSLTLRADAAAVVAATALLTRWKLI